MFGNNPKREAVKGDGNELFVKNIFKTIQGEGPNVGIPAIFIRLGGCNLACSFCDTEFEDFTSLKLSDIISQTTALALNEEGQQVIKLIVITGGEPLRQPISLLCHELIKLGYKVQIETNGTMFRELPEEVEIVCSPKVVNGKYHNIRPDLLARINAFKFLISENLLEYTCVPEFAKTTTNIPVYIQPMDQYDQTLNLNNLNLTIKLSIEKGYRLSLQTHKVIKID